MTKTNTSVLALAFWAALGAGACGGDSDGEQKEATPGVAPAGQGTGEAPGATAQPPAYVASTRKFSPDGSQTTTYVQVLSSIEAGSTVDTNLATEVQGAAELFSIEGAGWFAVGEGESPTIARYALSASGALEKKESLSLQPFGVTDFFANKLYVISPTKVYYPDPDTKQLIIINPVEMKVAGTVPLAETGREGYTAVYSYSPVERDGKILISVGWFDWTNDKIIPETGLAVIDTNTDKLVRFDVDKRCGGITQPVTLRSGAAYFASSALAGAAYQLKRLTTEPCVLRVKAGTDAFDPSYLQRLGELTGGALAGEPIPTGSDEIFLRVFDAKLATLKPESATYDVTGARAWGWRRWNPLTNQLTAIDALAPSTADTVWFEVGGRIFGTEAAADYTSSKLIELNAAGGPKPALSSPGLLSGLAKVR